MKFINCFFIIIFSISLFNSCSSYRSRYSTRNFNSTVIIDSTYKDPDAGNFEQVEQLVDSTVVIRTMRKDSTLISSQKFLNVKIRRNIGESKYWFPNGQIEQIINFDNQGNFDGNLITYHQNGKMKRNDNYKHGKLLKGKCLDSLGNELKYFPYQIDPKVNLNLIEGCLVYPEIMRRAGIQEKVELEVYLSKTGKIIKIKYDNGNSPDFINEAIRCVLKLEPITPYYIDGEPADLFINIPIEFRLK